MGPLRRQHSSHRCLHWHRPTRVRRPFCTTSESFLRHMGSFPKPRRPKSFLDISARYPEREDGGVGSVKCCQIDGVQVGRQVAVSFDRFVKRLHRSYDHVSVHDLYLPLLPRSLFPCHKMPLGSACMVISLLWALDHQRPIKRFTVAAQCRL